MTTSAHSTATTSIATTVTTAIATTQTDPIDFASKTDEQLALNLRELKHVIKSRREKNLRDFLNDKARVHNSFLPDADSDDDRRLIGSTWTIRCDYVWSEGMGVCFGEAFGKSFGLEKRLHLKFLISKDLFGIEPLFEVMFDLIYTTDLGDTQFYQTRVLVEHTITKEKMRFDDGDKDNGSDWFYPGKDNGSRIIESIRSDFSKRRPCRDQFWSDQSPCEDQIVFFEAAERCIRLLVAHVDNLGFWS